VAQNFSAPVIGRQFDKLLQNDSKDTQIEPRKG
jgi:hypothetical protein